MKQRTRFPLQLKVAIALFLTVMTPFAISAYLINQVGKVAANVGTSETSARTQVLEKSIEAYHDLVRTTKDLHREIALRLAQRPDLVALARPHDAAPAEDLATLAKLVNTEPGLRSIVVVRPDGTTITEASRASSGPAWRDKVVEEPLGNEGAKLRLAFEVSATINADLQQLKRSIDATRTFAQIKTALPAGYFTAFLVLITIIGLGLVGLGVWASTTIVTRRIAALVKTAREVSEGHFDARVKLRGRDEMAELGVAFNTMLDDLDAARAQVEYLQRMGVWQDVARRLAHEIKNPLTPIQLAVQQCVSTYKGGEADPVRFQKLLAETGEIVEEEITGLRRLVDTFRTLGALPKVEAAPLALADVIEELKLDPAVAPRMKLVPPSRPVTVRGDKLLLKRVLANLVENGMHAGQEAGHAGDVVVSWESRGDLVIITVDDHGKGVPESQRVRIFEPYVTTKSTGTGLGLAIARKIALEHNGDLAVAPDRAPTGGARFVVSLPLRGPDSSAST